MKNLTNQYVIYTGSHSRLNKDCKRNKISNDTKDSNNSSSITTECNFELIQISVIAFITITIATLCHSASCKLKSTKVGIKCFTGVFKNCKGIIYFFVFWPATQGLFFSSFTTSQ